MKELSLSIIATIMLIGGLIFWGVLITKGQVQDGFNVVGKMLTDLDSRVKVIETKK